MFVSFTLLMWNILLQRRALFWTNIEMLHYMERLCAYLWLEYRAIYLVTYFDIL